MLSNPRRFQVVRLHYAKKNLPIIQDGLQDRLAIVLAPGIGKPRNHLVMTLDRLKVFVPAGNVYKI